MKIVKIEADNFKIFKNLNMELNGKNTVLFGINGTGKSSALTIINLLFCTWVKRLNSAQGRMAANLSDSMVAVGAGKMSLSCEVSMMDGIHSFKKTYSKKPRKTTTSYNGSSYKDFSDLFIDMYADNDVNMPIFVNYGTTRTVLDIPLKIARNYRYNKFSAYERAIENGIDFKTFFEWYRNQEDIENEHKSEIGDLSYTDPMLSCVRKAVETMIGNVSGLRVKRNPLSMKVKKNNKEISVDMLSDGEKCTLALFGDLARRLAMANPSLSDPLKGEGIVMIDEIELHMHPSWQKRVLGVMEKLFPNIQFIVTTHSPQVLNEADDSYNIFMFEADDEGECNIQRINRMDGFDSNYILEEFMSTRSRNAVIERMYNKAYGLIDEGLFDEAKKIIDHLEEISGENGDIITIRGYMLRRRIANDKNN